MQNFSSRLKQARKARGMTQTSVARRLNIHRSTYTKYETDRSYPPLDVFCDMCVLFNVSADRLLGLTSEEESVARDDPSPFI